MGYSIENGHYALPSYYFGLIKSKKIMRRRRVQNSYSILLQGAGNTQARFGSDQELILMRLWKAYYLKQDNYISKLSF